LKSETRLFIVSCHGICCTVQTRRNSEHIEFAFKKTGSNPHADAGVHFGSAGVPLRPVSRIARDRRNPRLIVSCWAQKRVDSLFHATVLVEVPYRRRQSSNCILAGSNPDADAGMHFGTAGVPPRPQRCPLLDSYAILA
jgi:hypothetical protein